MLWLACVATAQAPTLSDRLSALEALVQAQLKQQENFSQKVAALESTCTPAGPHCTMWCE